MSREHSICWTIGALAILHALWELPATAESTDVPANAVRPRESSDPRIFWVILKDGSRFLATESKESTISVAASFGTFRIPIGSTEYCEFTQSGGSVVIRLRNGESLTAKTDTKTLKVTTKYGRMTVPISDILRMSATAIVRNHNQPRSAKTESSPESPCDYDRKSYSWMRGIANYSASNQAWIITYRLDGNDKYWGRLTLLQKDKTRRFQNGDVILVEGEIDAKHRDESGKPMYRVERLFGPLVRRPKPAP